LVSSQYVGAAPISYSFDTPSFPLNGTTPFVGIAPDLGPAGFLASFTTAPDANGFTVTTFPPPQPLITGRALVDPTGGAVDVLTVTTNTPIDRVELGFAILTSGSLRITTPVGAFTQPSGNVGGNFQGGTLSFTSPTPFNTFQLQALDVGGNPTRFGIDNLLLNSVSQASAVPEPASGLVVLIGAGAVAWRR